MAHGFGYRSEQRLRKENQDTYGVFEFGDFVLLVVCDGMGGHVGGRQASSIAVRTIHDEMQAYSGGDVRGALRRAIEAGNRAIYEMARKNYRLMGMGTTCVAAVVQGDTAHVAHVGDSRAYLVHDGQIRALTRDHTMVNLFVDAELLSPEDAATHPEAHVLSRSLGVERQVEVDLSEPIPLAQSDRIVLCSDGIHGVIGTSGLGNVDWRNPQEGVDATIEAVERADGDDNATLVAFGTAISGASASLTTPPDLTQLEEEARQAPSQVALQPVRRPTLVPNAGATAALDDAMAMEPLDVEISAADAVDDTGAPMPMRPKKAPSKKKGGSPVRRLVLVGGALAAVVVLSLGVVLMLPGDGGERPAAPASTAEGTTTAEAAPALPEAPPIAPPTDPLEVMPPPEEADILLAGSSTRGMNRTRCLDCTGSYALPTSAAYLSGADDPEVAVAFFAPDVPPAPRRVPNSASVYDHPPPSGPEQTKAVRAARNKRCREALDTVRAATQKSIDYASLYSAAWYCFNDTHTNAVARARAATWEDFKPLLLHFEGERRIPPSLLVLSGDAFGAMKPSSDDAMATDEAADGTAEAADDAVAEDEVEEEDTADTAEPEVANLPQMPDIWQFPAAGGMEYRLALFEVDGDVQGFRDIMLDLLGEAQVADHLAADVLLEATAAASIGRMETPHPEAVQAWARRVYVASRAMTGPVGELIRAHRPEVAGLIEALLFEATGGDEGLLAIEEGYPNEAVPGAVARAQAAGLAGQMPDLSGDLLDTPDELAMDGLAADPFAAPMPGQELTPDGRSSAGTSRRRSSGSRSGRPRSRDRSTTYRDVSEFDWENFGYLKVWYPRKRVPRVLLPYQVDASDIPTEVEIGDYDDVEVYKREEMDLDEDWDPADGAQQ